MCDCKDADLTIDKQGDVNFLRSHKCKDVAFRLQKQGNVDFTRSFWFHFKNTKM